MVIAMIPSIMQRVIVMMQTMMKTFTQTLNDIAAAMSSRMSIIASMPNFEFAFPTSLYKNVISIDSHRAAALFKNATGILGIMGPLRKRYLCVTSRERMRPTPELRDTRLTFETAQKRTLTNRDKNMVLTIPSICSYFENANIVCFHHVKSKGPLFEEIENIRQMVACFHLSPEE